MITSQSREIQALVDDIKEGRLLLPELQRRYVWKSTQVRDLFDSLYHQYPSGQLLVWETDDLPFSQTVSLDGLDSNQRRPQLLLDGQQRLTSLAAIMLGRELKVRGLKRAIDIVFNVRTEKFEVAGPRQRGEAGWISLTKLFTRGAIAVFMDLGLDSRSPDTKQILERLTRLENIKTYKYSVSVLEKLNYVEVTHIFVRINSGGTTLGSADLALAQTSSRWRGITQEFDSLYRQILKRTNQGLWLDTGILLRTMSALLSGQTRLSELFRGERQKITVGELQAAWKRVRTGMEQAIDFLVHNCKMDRLELLPTQYILIPLTAYFDRFGRDIPPRQARDLQRWVYMALAWSRYSTSAETAADQDIAALSKNEPIAELIQNIEDKVGKRPFSERELQEQRKNSPFMLMSYVLARHAEAEDWFNGIVIGSNQTLDLHHIFPKDVLRERYDLKADSRTIDQVANLAFLSQRANSRIWNRPPATYLPEIDPRRLKAQCVPNDHSLWELGRFEDFLRERRSLLADGLNHLLQSLAEEPSLWPTSDTEYMETRIDTIERQLRELIIDRLEEARGEQAWEALVPPDIRNSVNRRVAQHIGSKPFESGQFDTLAGKLELCQFSDYQKIISGNWALFTDLLGNQDRFKQHHQSVTEVRNALKHNRDLSRSDRAAAEAGLIWLEDCLREWLNQQAEDEEEDENGG